MKSEDKPFFVLLVGSQYSVNPENSVSRSILVNTVEEAGRISSYVTAVKCCAELENDSRLNAPIRIQRIMIEDVT